MSTTYSPRQARRILRKALAAKIAYEKRQAADANRYSEADIIALAKENEVEAYVEMPGQLGYLNYIPVLVGLLLGLSVVFCIGQIVIEACGR